MFLCLKIFLVVIVKTCIFTDRSKQLQTLLQTGANNFVNDKSPNITEYLTPNFITIVSRHKSIGLKNIFVSGITCNKRLSYSHIITANKKAKDTGKIYMRDFCWKWRCLEYGFISNWFTVTKKKWMRVSWISHICEKNTFEYKNTQRYQLLSIRSS